MIGVVDTSAVLRLFLPNGPIPDGLETFLRGVERGQNVAIAPELMLIEVGNVANKKRKRRELSGEEARELVRLVEAMPIQRVGHGGLLLPALALAEAHDLTAYDALYLALASRKAARLFTADDRLAAVAQDLGLA